MKNLFYLVVAIVAGLYYFGLIGPGAGFVTPAAAANRTAAPMANYEFTDLFARNRPTSSLAVDGHYTVVEGYTDSCTICRQLEADFAPFLRQRPDVVIRRLRFSEESVSQSFAGDTQAELERSMSAYFSRLGRYNFNHVEKTAEGYSVSTCGTPHIEIYGPDRQPLAMDTCADGNSKKGLAFIRNWIEAERR